MPRPGEDWLPGPGRPRAPRRLPIVPSAVKSRPMTSSARTPSALGTRRPGGTPDDARPPGSASNRRLPSSSTTRFRRVGPRTVMMAAPASGCGLGSRKFEGHVDLSGGPRWPPGASYRHASPRTPRGARAAIRASASQRDVLQRVGGGQGGPRAGTIVKQINERLDRRGVGGRNPKRRGHTGRVLEPRARGRHSLRRWRRSHPGTPRTYPHRSARCRNLEREPPIVPLIADTMT